jgi:hypothetical protein
MPVTDPVKTIEERQSNPQPKPLARQIGGDANEVKIDRGRSRFNPHGTAITFGTFQGSPCARVRQRTQDMVITIVTMDLGNIAAGQIQTLVENLIEDTGPQLGIPETVSLVQEIAGEHRVIKQRGDEPDAVGGAGKRRQVTITVSLLTRSAA